jgi:hypothetical protein
VGEFECLAVFSSSSKSQGVLVSVPAAPRPHQVPELHERRTHDVHGLRQGGGATGEAGEEGAEGSILVKHQNTGSGSDTPASDTRQPTC